MIAKVIKLKRDIKSVSRLLEYVTQQRADEVGMPLDGGVQAVAEYIAREGMTECGSFNLDGLDPSDPADKQLAKQQMDYVMRRGGAVKNPYYHYVLSWQEGEKPDGGQVRDAVQHTLNALGMQHCQAIYAIHRDKEHHHHVHVVVNRVDPSSYLVAGPPRYDYFVLDKACREIELKHGWAHDNGPYVVIDGRPQRLTKAQREKLGLYAQKEHAAAPDAAMLESKTGLPSLQAFVRGYVAHKLVECETWEQLHQELARHGLRLQKLQSGLQVVGQGLDGETEKTKASAVDYRLSLARLEKRLGRYQEPAALDAVSPLLSYPQYLHLVMAGVEPHAGERPEIGHLEKRREQREARARAREALYRRYIAERQAARAARQGSFKELAARQKMEMRQLKAELAARRARRIEELHADKRIAAGLWSAERAREIALLKERHKIERAALKRLSDVSWRAWVEREAQKGDRAAQSALRGLRYREQRERKRLSPGFEGEDLDDHLKPAPSAGNGIVGEQRKRLDSRAAELLMRYEVDEARQVVRYKDQHGRTALEDLGQRIECRQSHSDEAIMAGLMLASAKYGEVLITGDDEFKRRAVDLARKIGVRVANPELRPEPSGSRLQNLERL